MSTMRKVMLLAVSLWAIAFLAILYQFSQSQRFQMDARGDVVLDTHTGATYYTDSTGAPAKPDKPVPVSLPIN